MQLPRIQCNMFRYVLKAFGGWHMIYTMLCDSQRLHMRFSLLKYVYEHDLQYVSTQLSQILANVCLSCTAVGFNGTLQHIGLQYAYINVRRSHHAILFASFKSFLANTLGIGCVVCHSVQILFFTHLHIASYKSSTYFWDNF